MEDIRGSDRAGCPLEGRGDEIRKCVVITTINEPTEAIHLFIRTGYDVIIVGDVRTPNSYRDLNVIFLDVDTQRRMFPTLCDLLPYNHYCRKNLGYLYAILNGYNVIAESDDDTYPSADWRFFESLDQDRIKMITGTEFPNVFRLFTDKDIYPRGYPLDEIKKENGITLRDNCKTVKVIQTTIDNEPDVDALTRLLNRDYLTTFDKDRESCYTFDKNVWTQINTQNTIFLCADIFYLLYLPCTTTFRVCDILRGYILQRCLFEEGSSVLFACSTAHQDRNPHDLLRDLRDEIPLYTDTKKILETLQGVRLAGTVDDLETIYTRLVPKYVSARELDIVREFVKIYRGRGRSG